MTKLKILKAKLISKPKKGSTPTDLRTKMAQPPITKLKILNEKLINIPSQSGLQALKCDQESAQIILSLGKMTIATGET